jgi:hypothetical protein
MTLAELLRLKPRPKTVVSVPQERPTRRSLRIKDMDEELTLALASAKVDHLDAEPKKLMD